jgi:uncharacterized protein
VTPPQSTIVSEESLPTEPEVPLAIEPSATDLGPVRASERIAEMDILRGFALLGICVINLQSFLGPYGVTGEAPLFPAWFDRTAEFLINLFGSGKFNAMFSFLFGVGFAIQMERAASKDVSFATMYLRRLIALFVFGAAHLILLWEGDVLHIYAAIGLPLILFRTLRDRWLWLIVMLTLFAPIAWFGYTSIRDGEPSPEKQATKAREAYDHAILNLKVHGKGEYLVPPFVAPRPKQDKDKAVVVSIPSPLVQITAHSTYSRVVALRVKDWIRGMREGVMWFWAIMATTLLIGFIAGRRRIFQNIPSHLKFIRWATIVSGVVGLGIALIFATASLLAPSGGGGGLDGESLLAVVAILGYIFGRPFLCAFYMGVLILLAQNARARSYLAPLALVGRMPLTNYLVHSLVFSLLFYGYGLGLYYRVGPALSLPIAFTLYAIQVAYSNWWMKRFRFGPAEWLWRTVTYGKPPAMTAPSLS